MEEEVVWQRLLKFVSLRPRSRKEVSTWFKRKKISEKIQGKLIQKLFEFELLDDKKFAVWWVEQRLVFRPRSKRLLRHELLSKGIDKSLINETIKEAQINELEIAKKMLRKRKHEDSRKAAGYLSRQGFSWDIIKDVIDGSDDER